MALTTAGRTLTKDHKLEQIRLGGRFVAASQILLGELNPIRLDATMSGWLGLQVLLGEAFHRDSANLAAAYLSEYRTAEVGQAAAGMPIVRPVFDATTTARKAALLVPMAKNATAGGLAARAAVDHVFWQLVNEWRTESMAGGRDLVDESTLANNDSIGWRRVTDGDPCTWCAMLATRGPAYRSAETAGEGRFYHPRCGCTAEEVFGEWVPTAEEQRFIDLYEASHEPDMSAQETTAAMRENGQGVVNDATKPKTETGGAGNGGRIPPRRFTPGGMDVPDRYPPTSSGDEPPFLPSERPHISRGSRNHILAGHRHDGTRRTRFPRDWSDEAIMEAVDLTLAAPTTVERFGDQFVFEREVEGRVVHVSVRTDKPRPFVWTAYPLPR